LLQYNGQSAPAFSAWNSSATSCTNSAWTKITYGTEEFDTNNNFASSTFTPTVAGYYQLNSTATLSSPFSGLMMVALYKNGSLFKRLCSTTNSGTYGANGSCIVYANGSTDYFEIYLYQTSGGSINTNADSTATYFNGCLLRGA
jgi:hypothetical protein